MAHYKMQVFYSADVQSTLHEVSCREDGFSYRGISNSRAWQTCIDTPVLPALLWLMGNNLSSLSPCSLWVFLRFCGWAWEFFVCFIACFNGEGVIWKAMPWPHSDSFCCHSALHWTQSWGQEIQLFFVLWHFIPSAMMDLIETLCFPNSFKDSKLQ